MANETLYKIVRKQNMENETRSASTKPQANRKATTCQYIQFNLLVLRVHSFLLISYKKSVKMMGKSAIIVVLSLVTLALAQDNMYIGEFVGFSPKNLDPR